MSTNSPSETLWEVLHGAQALLTDDGFADPVPPWPAVQESREPPTPTEGYDELVARYRDHLEFSSVWPAGKGGPAPQALILTTKPLSDEAWTFVRSWFENPRVNLTLAGDFFVQPLPPLAGEQPPYQKLARELCALLHPKALLSLGALPAQRLLGAPLSLDTLRGSDFRFDRWSMVTTLDPEAFLSLAETDKSRFKGQVWRDLQRLLGKLKYG